MLCAYQAAFEWDPLLQGAGPQFDQQVKMKVYQKSVGEHQSQAEDWREESESHREPSSGSYCSVSWESLDSPCSPASVPTCVTLGGRHWVHVHSTIFLSLFHCLQDPNYVIGLAEHLGPGRGTATVPGYTGNNPIKHNGCHQ